LAGTSQGWYKRACQRGLDGFRSNAEHTWEEGERNCFDGIPEHVLIFLTPEYIAQVATISL
jgi:hypothetical protein